MALEAPAPLDIQKFVKRVRNLDARAKIADQLDKIELCRMIVELDELHDITARELRRLNWPT